MAWRLVQSCCYHRSTEGLGHETGCRGSLWQAREGKARPEWIEQGQ